MKKMKMRFGTLVGVIFLCANSVFAVSNPINDHTLINCIDGDNTSGVAFDSTQPYQTLKAGIEATTAYIASNINKAGNEATASGMVMNIKVKCSMKDILNPQIDLNFLGKQYNNELIIEGIEEDALIIDDMYFYIHNNTGYITFKNAKFVNNILKPYYFTGASGGNYTQNYAWGNRYNYYIFQSIYIENSYIKLNTSSQIGSQGSFDIRENRGCTWRGCSYSYHNIILNMNYFHINNTKIEVDINQNYTFDTPKILKNSKLSFKNITQSGTYISGTGTINILFQEKGFPSGPVNAGFSALISNEIDFGNNNFVPDDINTFFFVNNKFFKFSNFSIGTHPLYINNLFENKSSLEIGENKDMYNNIFTSGVTDSSDPNNLRRNFHIDNISSGGLGWVFKRTNSDKYFNLDFSSVSLYKEITGNDLTNGLGDIYVIFTH